MSEPNKPINPQPENIMNIMIPLYINNNNSIKGEKQNA